MKKEDLPKKRGLTVDEIISKYPMTVRILLVQLVEQIERLQKKPKITEEWIEEKAKGVWRELGIANEGEIAIIKDFIRSLVEEMSAKKTTVSEEFVEEHARKIVEGIFNREYTMGNSQTLKALKQMLKKAGVEVVTE